MDAWRDAYFERAKKRRVRAKERNPQSGELGFAAQPLRQPVPVHAPRFALRHVPAPKPAQDASTAGRPAARFPYLPPASYMVFWV